MVLRNTSARLDLFLALNDLTALVVSALGTSLMRRLGFQALGANARRDRLKEVMCAPFSPTCLRVSPFWIRHEAVFSLCRTNPLPTLILFRFRGEGWAGHLPSTGTKARGFG